MSKLEMDIPTQGTVRNICIWVSNVLWDAVCGRLAFLIAVLVKIQMRLRSLCQRE